MSEILGKQAGQKDGLEKGAWGMDEMRVEGETGIEEVMGAENEGAVSWESLREEGQEADWASVGEVKYRGDEIGEGVGEVAAGGAEKDGEAFAGEVGKNGEAVAAKVERLKGWIDLEAIAQGEDPEGLAAAEREGEVRRGRVEDCKVALAEKDGEYAEIEKRREVLPEELAVAKRELELFDRKGRQGALSGVKKALGIGVKKRAELAATVADLEAERERLWQEKGEIEDERGSLEATIAGVDIDGPKREFLEKFETPLSPEEKKEGLDFEALAELSTEEYLRLWRRLNPFFVTHVTRQGIRDHNAMIYHSAGMGEFQEGMTGVLEDGKVLRTPAEVRLGLGREISEANVEKALGEMLFNTEVDIEGMRARGMSDKGILDELVGKLPVNTTIAAAEPWADKRAVHFAQLAVLDDYYGGESGNEAFFVFPTDVVASQCRFGGHIRGNLMTAEVDQERKWNDMFVWPQEKDITIDAGLTFLPKGTMVDPETGSKYATKIVEVEGREVRVPEVDEEAVGKFTEWMLGLTAEDAAVKAATGGMDGRYDVRELREAALTAGVSERILDEVLDLSGGFQYNLRRFVEGGDFEDLTWRMLPGELEKMTPEERRERSVKEALDGKSAAFKLAENAVPAEEYWEGYFREHPSLRPAHVIYYDGDPSAAVIKTLKEAGVLEEMPRPYGASGFGQEWQRVSGKSDSHERDGDFLGFEENRVVDMREDEAMRAEHEKFNEMARKVVAEHYGLEVD